MFSNKENINILTALLAAHGVKRVVVCPGSRNAPVVHSLNECQEITCYPVTDERSAGFYALGMSLACGSPVAVCVTSGTALLNLAPAVAESSYRHHGIIVISADRPEAWIGQLDGQTLPQPGAFGGFVGKCVNLPEPRNDEERWLCNRLVNEALAAVKTHGRKAVHINVPVSEPLFVFDTVSLPRQRVISPLPATLDRGGFSWIALQRLAHAQRPMLVVGQLDCWSEEAEQAVETIGRKIAVLSEPLSSGTTRLFDLALAAIGDDGCYMPDFVIYVGDTVVSKRLKQFLRKAEGMECLAVAEDGEVHDTFMRQVAVVEGRPEEALLCLADAVAGYCESLAASRFRRAWQERMAAMEALAPCHEPAYSQLAAVREFELSLDDMDYAYHVHYANSTAVRLACVYAGHHVWCNRGVNGIEGSLSTAAGFSVASADMVFCVIGDLSFFYDQNALWNTNLRGNFRIILLNNSCGGIFYSLRGLRDSAAFTGLVSARHTATAQGVCAQNDVGYLAARNMDELRIGLATLMTAKTNRPMLLEVFTDAENDKRAIKELMNEITGK